MALVGPIGYSLSVLLERIAPENKEFLGYVTGVGALVVVLAGPLVGILSDRTRSRLGRRRPWLIGLTMVGLAGLLIVSVSPNVWIALLGWGVTQLGFGIAGLQVTSSMGDRLPESQRGKVAGLTGVATMVASIAGVGLASAFATSNLLIFLFPGLVGATFILLFAVFVKEPDLRNAAAPEKVTMGSLLSGYGYNVKKYKDFSWNWLGRFLFNFGVTLSSTFTTFFFAAKLGRPVSQIGGIVAIAGLLGIVFTVGGAALSGFLSDRLKRRKPFILLAGVLFAVGAVIAWLAPDLPVLLIGLCVLQIGLGIFSAVDQALYLDVLPEQDTQAGRFVAITQFSTSIPQVAAPLLAPAFLLLGAGSEEDNYGLLYLISAGFALIGGLVILLRVKSVR
ncbi:MFS transporter [Streptomyces sp. NL15-2K]|uniref:MFS transporter n=1 Tax=Streptomyces sp. NL15-2K TaxID=376149 RepID=UPI0026EC8AFD|nr:MFS transporter [Kutzneria buriramensis]WKX06327.1 MFS transporter [Kutzneria buriramensis]